jgi:hypothetical protein
MAHGDPQAIIGRSPPLDIVVMFGGVPRFGPHCNMAANVFRALVEYFLRCLNLSAALHLTRHFDAIIPTYDAAKPTIYPPNRA